MVEGAVDSLDRNSYVPLITRYFSEEGKDIYKEIPWDKSDIQLTDDDNKPTFKQKDCEFPAWFSSLARKVVASRYFYGYQKSIERESSYRQLGGRVCETIADWGLKDNYFNKKEALVFEQELAKLVFNQMGAFNSPVWFNVGLHRYKSRKLKDEKLSWIIAKEDMTIPYETPYGNVEMKVKKGTAVPVSSIKDKSSCQTSACFIQSVGDTMEDILMLAVYEGLLFRHGSGTGTDLSTLRSARETLSGGGKPSGPLAYLCFYDQIARIVKSGGRNRRAAKMDSLKDKHPDIKEFIEAKTTQEKLLKNLIRLGYNPNFAKENVLYQNANLSVRLSDEFMNAVEEDKDWKTIPVHSMDLADDMPTYKARQLFQLIAEGTYICGDPGIQYDTTINLWHTCPNSGPINASNPCSEFMFIDNSSCNLASLNLRGFVDENGKFKVSDFKQATRIFAIAQDLLYDNSSYPRKEIAENSYRFRPLGQGYANLGGLLMSMGIPYDSDEGRAIASTISALQTANVYKTSIEMAKKLGPFEAFEENKEPMLKVIKMHRDHVKKIDGSKLPKNLGLEEALDSALEDFEYDFREGEKYGFRNAQATVLAPTGTIGFMMDCDTTGMEPDIALIKYKLLAEGGTLKIVNNSVPFSLKKLGYSNEQIESIKKYLDENETIEGSELKEEHLPVFDCAFKPKKGKRFIGPRGHLKMMAAIQPFISGAISKTINLDEKVTAKEIENIYKEAWKMGLKAVAIYREGTKNLQPLSVSKKSGGLEQILTPIRRKLSTTRNSITHKFNVAGHEGYLTVGLYENGDPGELFITMSKEGSTIGGLMDTIGTLTSFALQYGIPLGDLANKLRNNRFEPYGVVYEGHEDIKTVLSLTDYIYTWMAKKFGCEIEPNPKAYDFEKAQKRPQKAEEQDKNSNKKSLVFAGEPGGFCIKCGSQMFRFGHCEERCSNPKCDHISYNGCGQ